MKDGDTRRALLSAFWSITPIIIAFVAAIFIAIAKVGFDWILVLHAFRIFWLALLILTITVYILVFLGIKYPYGTPRIALIIITLIFYLASIKEHFISEHIRNYINKIFELDYLVAAITILALAVAFATIRKAKVQT